VGFYRVAERLPESTLKGLTHIISWTSANPSEGCAPRPVDIEKLTLLSEFKVAHPHLRVMLGIGMGAEAFSEVAASPELTRNVAETCSALVDAWGFDGLDVDWEFPEGDADKANLTAFMSALRSALDGLGTGHKNLTMDTPSAWLPDTPPSIDFVALGAHVDWFNVMMYDAPQPLMAFSGRTGFNAPLSVPTGAPEFYAAVPNIEVSVALYRNAGVPDDKIVAGLPFYAYRYRYVEHANNGLWQLYDKTKPDAYAQVCYRTLDSALASSVRTWNDGAASPWLWDAAMSTAISYDDPESLTAKATWAHTQGLGGVMIWPLDCDKSSGELASAIIAALAVPLPTSSTTTDPGPVPTSATSGSGSDTAGRRLTRSERPAQPIPIAPAFTG